MIALLVSRYQQRNKASLTGPFETAKQSSEQTGLLFASGLITGEALIGIILAIPVAITGSTSVFALVDEPIGSLPGLVVVGVVCYMLYRFAKNAFKELDIQEKK